MNRTSRVLRVPLLLGILGVLACQGSPAPSADETATTDLWPDSWRYDEDVTPAVGEHGMVVTTDRYASEVGVEVLRDGGNAVDAAVAVSFALAVVNPEAGNIGGGGFMVARMADGEAYALDYREKAPLGASRDMFLDEEGNLTDRSVVGHLAVGVPGTVMGMWEAHRRFGTLPWERLVEPAVELARGFRVTDRFTHSLTSPVIEGLRRFATSTATYLPGGEPPQPGDTLHLSDLARTMERIRDEGADGFYAGETADLVVAEMERGGGLITHEDLRTYAAAWREPVRFTYRGHAVLSMPPSSSGGITIAEGGNILERYEMGPLPWLSAERVHLFVEAFRRAFADRNHYLADPDFVEMPRSVLTSDEYAAFRARTVDRDRATPSSEVDPGVEAYLALGDAPDANAAPDEGRHTTHFSIVDQDGNAVAITTTINSWYGSKVTVAGAGFLLNNEMDDFAAKPGTPNQYGLVQGEANAVQPGKRMLSAMTPSIVLDPRGELLMVTGTPGGSTIITTTWQTISNVVDYGMNASQAVLAPRVHHQHLPDQVYYEQGGLSPDVVDALRAMGHTVVERDGVSGDVQLILVAPDGTLRGQSDPRRGGVALGW
ncbi:MAG: gamma-glutamyltransferase [Gemmatimonadota bacterium]|jgi:gamma-glutamyltranspeptidase/glutathione hydrolase